MSLIQVQSISSENEVEVEKYIFSVGKFMEYSDGFTIPIAHLIF